MDNRKRIDMTGYSLRGIVVLLFLLCLSATARAEEQTYSGDFLSRSTLTGDWGGARNDLAKKGFTIDLNVTQTEQGVVGGGKSSSWEYGGRGNLMLNIDTGKMGLWPGGFLMAEVEGNFGHDVNGSTGALMPVNTNQIFPLPKPDEVCIPALNFTQFLSEYFGLLVGKIDVTSGDPNEFAHGTNGYAKGDTQFMNMALNVNPNLVMTFRYNPLAAGMVILPTKDPKGATVMLLVADSDGAANTTGFTTLNKNKLTFLGQGRVRTDFFGKTGHQLIGYAYSNKEFVSLDQRLENIVTNSIAKQKGSWAFYYNFDQYFYEPEKGSGKGVGVFGRFGASDGNPNPIHYFFSLGIGGKGMMASRPHDQFGFGWYFIDVKNPSFTGPVTSLQVLRDEQGFEAFYSVALTPWALLTPDIQVVHPAQKNTVDLSRPFPFIREGINTATVLGLRLRVVF
jgi:porin